MAQYLHLPWSEQTTRGEPHRPDTSKYTQVTIGGVAHFLSLSCGGCFLLRSQFTPCFVSGCLFRRQTKHTSCRDNHGIRPPTPEQYLTPLQQKEVCIRHLRARLRENVERLQHRDCEIDELRSQLYKMQEEWIEGECHRVEAQLALKEARMEIQHLQEVVETAKSNLSVREPDPNGQRSYSGPGGRSRSCGCSPASTLSRSTNRTRLSRPRPPGQTHLLLEAALLPEPLPTRSHSRPPPTVPRSANYDRLCSGGVRSQACSPTMTWLCDGSSTEEVSVTSTATPDVCTSEPQRHLSCLPRSLHPEAPYTVETLQPNEPPEPHTCQPQPTTSLPLGQDTLSLRMEVEQNGTNEADGENEDNRSAQSCHWSRYFLVDLLAVAVPVVPAVAWLCRGAPRDVMPIYQIGSLLRGCCAVALHSLRRQGVARVHRPTNMNGATP
uniref:Syntaphilin n=1 Tax=Cynoglossus semilaevis TaxID=244447 RepID=A0A3P8X4N5_CYNSE